MKQEEGNNKEQLSIKWKINKEQIKINQTKSSVFEKINTVDAFLARLMREREKERVGKRGREREK